MTPAEIDAEAQAVVEAVHWLVELGTTQDRLCEFR